MTNLIRSLRDRIEHVVFSEYSMSAEGLALFRISYAAYFLIIGGVVNTTYISENPDYFFNPLPLSITALFSGFPPYWFFATLSATLAILHVLLLFGYHTRLVSITLSLLLVLSYSFVYSFGKVDHNILQLLVPIVMAPSNWGNAYSLDARLRHHKLQPVQSWPLAMLAWMLSFAFFTSGVPKLLGGWLDPATQAVQGHLVENYFIIERRDFLATFFLELRSPLVWEVLDWATIFFELGFLVAVFHRRLLNFFIFVAVCFHMMNLLILNIVFLDNFTTYLGFISWGTVVLYLRHAGWEQYISRFMTFRNLAIVGVLALVFLATEHSPFYAVAGLLGVGQVMAEGVFTHTAGLILVLLHAVSSLRRYRMKPVHA